MLTSCWSTESDCAEHTAGTCLYHNNRNGTFTDVTRKTAGLDLEVYGMGVAVGDYDD